MPNFFLIFSIFLLWIPYVIGQTAQDTIGRITLDSILIQGDMTGRSFFHEKVNDLYLFAGKKNEIISPADNNSALAEKYGRLIFSKIPGVFVYDMDGTGNQMNISTRGLDPHRGWEFNIRKDGVITNTDMYGYPASHYNIPMEAVERIELIRGTSAQQYGGQFGGMLNYVSKKPSDKKIGIESINTVGSFGLVSTYNSISGTLNKWQYNVWINKKQSDGYRKSSNTKYDGEGVSLIYSPDQNFSLKLDFAHSDYNIQLAGPITDQQFKDDPTQATRNRNYYEPDIYVPSVTVDWKMSDATELKFISSSILGSRSSVMFDKPATTLDEVVEGTGQYSNRQVDIDNYHSFYNEVRLNTKYDFLQRKNNLSYGLLWINNDLHRQQQGVGSTGFDYDLKLVTPGWGRDLHFKTNNIALFAENNWVLTDRFSINTAARLEMGKSELTGVVKSYVPDGIPNTIDHKFPTLGASFQYDMNIGNVYGGWSQAYRPAILMNIVPASTYEIADKNLKDASGYNAEAGYRGQINYLKWDFTLYYLSYRNRLGTLAFYDAQNTYYAFRTNIGDSHNKGAELFLESVFPVSDIGLFSIFTSSAVNIAKYKDAKIAVKGEDVDISGNYVESTPKLISRNGVSLKTNILEVGLQYSYTAESFADALNTVTPDQNGATGLVPAYSLVDAHIKWKFNERYSLVANVNNALNKHYFTKRPQFYPGPGVWPSDGRSFSLTWKMKW